MAKRRKPQMERPRTGPAGATPPSTKRPGPGLRRRPRVTQMGVPNTGTGLAARIAAGAAERAARAGQAVPQVGQAAEKAAEAAVRSTPRWLQRSKEGLGRGKDLTNAPGAAVPIITRSNTPKRHALKVTSKQKR